MYMYTTTQWKVQHNYYFPGSNGGTMVFTKSRVWELLLSTLVNNWRFLRFSGLSWTTSKGMNMNRGCTELLYSAPRNPLPRELSLTHQRTPTKRGFLLQLLGQLTLYNTGNKLCSKTEKFHHYLNTEGVMTILGEWGIVILTFFNTKPAKR